MKFTIETFEPTGGGSAENRKAHRKIKKRLAPQLFSAVESCSCLSANCAVEIKFGTITDDIGTLNSVWCRIVVESYPDDAAELRALAADK